MPYPKPDLTISLTIRALREERGVTRATLAYRAGITTGALARAELGYAAPSWDTVRRVAGALGLSLGDFVAVVESRGEALAQR